VRTTVTQRVTVPIGGFSRESRTPGGLERLLAATAGVVRVYVNPMIEMAYVEYDPMTTSPSGLAGVIARAGFEVGAPIQR
jgi:hypothetical protein